VTIGRSVSGTSYRIFDQREVAPDQLPAADQGAAPLRELGSAISFKIRARDAARPKQQLSVDEKSRIQALDRTQPGLPMKTGRCGTMTHGDTRHGTTTLCAALDVLEGR
jgi:hypothetical protein